MSSHDIRISVEHYENGGFGVIGYNYQEMGLSNITGVKDAVERIMFKEMEDLKEDSIKD